MERRDRRRIDETLADAPGVAILSDLRAIGNEDIEPDAEVAKTSHKNSDVLKMHAYRDAIPALRSVHIEAAATRSAG
jgi:hypothetical protein